MEPEGSLPPLLPILSQMNPFHPFMYSRSAGSLSYTTVCTATKCNLHFTNSFRYGFRWTGRI